MKSQVELVQDLRRVAEGLADVLKHNGYSYAERQEVMEHLSSALRLLSPACTCDACNTDSTVEGV